jgi:hypothetical protein
MAAWSRQGIKNPCPFSSFSHGKWIDDTFIYFVHLTPDAHCRNPHGGAFGLGCHVLPKILDLERILKLALE